MTPAADINIRRYPWIQFSTNLFGWFPVFFLYFSSMVPLSSAILLGSIYYLCVTLAEVPSGYFSDRYGRRITMLVAAACFVTANIAYIAATDFTGLVLGQVLLALGMAFLSGTDTAFLYDSLLSLDREGQYAEQEARGQQFGMTGLALASLAGGALGLADLRLPYGLALIGALWAFWLTWGCVEPRVHRQDGAGTGSFLHSIRDCLRLLSDRTLAWLFGVMVFMYSLGHVAYEFYQPYLRLLGLEWLAGDTTTLVSGVVGGVSMFGGALGAALSVRLHQRLGIRALLYIAFAMQLVIIGGLAFLLAQWVLILVILRNFPWGLIYAPVNAQIAPRVGSHLRATYLSLQSLMGRLVFSGLLLFLSSTVDNQALSWTSLSLVLREAFAFAAAAFMVAVVLAPRKNMRS